MSEREHCGNCAFAVKTPLHWGYHIACHRKAPIVFHGVTGTTFTPTGSASDIHIVKETMGPVTAWPEVQDQDFCGEWELEDAK